MRAAGIDEIFSSGSSGDPPISVAADAGDFFAAASAPVAQVEEPEENDAAEAEDEDEEELEAFQQEAQPELKTREEMIRDGIDRTPMLSVAQIREKFSKNATPVFPKAPAGILHKKSKSGVAMNKSTSQVDNSSVSQPEEGPVADEAAQIAQSAESAQAAQAAQAASLTEPAQPEISKLDVAQLNEAEFLKIATLHGCAEAIAFYTKPQPVDIIIKPETPPGRATSVLVKHMDLQFNAEQRLLVMIRKAATRYIRLNDVVKIDATPQALSFLAPEDVPSETKGKVPISLYFSTTRYPMVIMVSDEKQRDQLLHLILFLRQLLRSENELQVCA